MVFFFKPIPPWDWGPEDPFSFIFENVPRVQSSPYGLSNFCLMVILRIQALQCQAHSLNACNAALPAKSKMATRGPQNDLQVWKGVDPQVFGRSRQLLLNNFLIWALLQREKFGTENNKGKKWNKNNDVFISKLEPK